MTLIEHTNHLLQYDGVLHWCFLLAVAVVFIGMAWVVLRILIPLRHLVQEASSITSGKLPTFDTPSSGIAEIETLRQSLRYMIHQIATAQDREVAYRNAITESQENERMRIAREIHDDTIQSLVLVGHSLERAVLATERHTEPIIPFLKDARSQLLQTVDSLRHMIVDLRPTVLDELGLVVAIELICERYSNVAFEVIGTVFSIEHAQELAIFRAAQEAIHNAQSHAHAQDILVTLAYSNEAVSLEVHDNGQGFKIPPQLQEFASKGHFGLIGIRERILHLGGQLSLRSELALGTQVVVTIPTLKRTLAIA